MGIDIVIDDVNAAPQSQVGNTWLSKLLRGIYQCDSTQDRLVGSLQLNNLNVRPGDVFIALPGLTADGRDYVDHAVKRHAAAVVFEKNGSDREDQLVDNVPVIGVAGLREHLGEIASRYYGSPSSKMKVVGVTGTNGKTTTAFLVAQALEQQQRYCFYSGTLGTGRIGALHPSLLTTVDAISMHGMLAEFVAQGADALAMEVSSHGLDQGRANGVEFDVGIFTNLTQDHLDYHGSMQLYGEAKKKLFEFPSITTAVINVDDDFGRSLADSLGRRVDGPNCITYGFTDADLSPRNLVVNDQGIQFELEFAAQTMHVSARLLGELNVSNLLATIGAMIGLGFDPGQVCGSVAALEPPPGRMEVFRGDSTSPSVIVDFAHTPDALRRALCSLRPLCQGRLVVVFGCGGDRDRGKRSQMGAIAEQFADAAIVTDDNPRTESAIDIVNQILSGMKEPARVVHDRKQAVAEAIAEYGPGDIILLAGKGHESTQAVDGRVLDLNDREFVAELLGGKE
jgi:UDP-N-acetylmuramoyl-L-alanyl-D-glutamate--2,6-diaminopimelate ligase